jgi:hypothetical protein
VAFARRRRLWVLLALVGGVFYTARAVTQFITLPGQDLTYDFGQHWQAAVDLNRGADPYTPFLTQCPEHFCPRGYTYPPLLAELLRPLALLPLHAAGAIWLGLMHLCVIAAIVITYRLIGAWISPSTGAVLLAATLFFFPLYQALYFIQVIPLLTLLLALAAADYGRGREARSGMALGVGAVLRISPVLQAPAFLVERRQLRRPVGLAALVGTATVLLAALILLSPHTLEYFTTVAPRIARGSAELDNQSPAALLLRLDVLLPGVLPIGPILLATVIAAAVLATTWWFSRGPGDLRRKALIFAAFLGAAPLLTTVTEPYHYTTELLVIGLAAASLSIGTAPWWLAVVSYPLLWIDGHLTNPIALSLGLAGPTGWRVLPFLFLTGTNLIGSVLLWLACVLALRRSRAAAASG